MINDESIKIEFNFRDMDAEFEYEKLAKELGVGINDKIIVVECE